MKHSSAWKPFFEPAKTSREGVKNSGYHKMRGGRSSLPRGKGGEGDPCMPGFNFYIPDPLPHSVPGPPPATIQGGSPQGRGMCVFEELYCRYCRCNNVMHESFCRLPVKGERPWSLHDFPVPEPDDAMEILFMPVLVRDHDDRLVHPLVDLTEEFQDNFRIF
jgi:hypothetical protein